MRGGEKGSDGGFVDECAEGGDAGEVLGYLGEGPEAAEAGEGGECDGHLGLVVVVLFGSCVSGVRRRRTIEGVEGGSGTGVVLGVAGVQLPSEFLVWMRLDAEGL